MGGLLFSTHKGSCFLRCLPGASFHQGGTFMDHCKRSRGNETPDLEAWVALGFRRPNEVQFLIQISTQALRFTSCRGSGGVSSLLDASRHFSAQWFFSQTDD